MAESVPLLDIRKASPPSAFTFAKDTPHGRRPQAIAHRGYKAANPENTMSAFKGAVEIGAHAIETDLHLTKDGVVVLSHDPTLKRCFGKEEKIADCDWDYVKTLRTTQEPHQSMPRLRDLLEYLATPGLEDIWLLLDIKTPVPTFKEALLGRKTPQIDNYVDDLFRLIAATLAEVKPSRPWTQRVQMGCWAAKYLPLCTKHLPEYPITHIGFGIDYARQFLKVPGVNINMFQMLLVGPRGNALLREVKRKKSDRSVLLWTVNEESWMKWSIRKEVDGVITDDPKKYLEMAFSHKFGEADNDLVQQLFNFTLCAASPVFPQMPIPKPPKELPQDVPAEETCLLRRIPPEIRIKIFEQLVGTRCPCDTLWLGTSPAVDIRPTAPVAPAATGPPAAPVSQTAPGTPAAPTAQAGPASPVLPPIQEPVRPSKPEESSVYSTPGILAALRTSTTMDLHDEALEVFYAVNTFKLDLSSFRSFSQLRVETVQMIKHLLIDIDIRPSASVPETDVADFLRLFNYSRSNITMATGLRRVLIWTNSDETAFYALMVHAAKNWVNLRALTLLDNHWATGKGLNFEAEMLAFMKQWLKVQEHTKDWVYHAPRIPPPPRIPGRIVKWGSSISQWMAPKDKNLQYTVLLYEKVKQPEMP